MKVWQLIELLKKCPQHREVIINRTEGYDFDKVESIKEIEVEQASYRGIARGELTEEKEGNIRMKAIYIRCYKD